MESVSNGYRDIAMKTEEKKQQQQNLVQKKKHSTNQCFHLKNKQIDLERPYLEH